MRAGRQGAADDKPLRQIVAESMPLVCHITPSVSPWNIGRLMYGDFLSLKAFAEAVLEARMKGGGNGW